MTVRIVMSCTHARAGWSLLTLRLWPGINGGSGTVINDLSIVVARPAAGGKHGPCRSSHAPPIHI